MKKRVSQHKRRRPGSWKTYEIKSMQVKVGDIDKILSDIKLEEINTILIDCLTNLLFRIIDRYNLDNIEIINNRVEKEIEKKVTLFFKTILSRLKSSNLNVIIISNEVGMGVVPAFPLGRI
jgi:adenosylcobinamide kinase/adenosylcobinamide-phosphate guanylyltransferase